MKTYPKIGIQVADILLPKEEVNHQKWAVIACDQFTSQPEYWQEVKAFIGDAPSTYNIILPEVFLGKPEEAEHIRTTHEKMNAYLESGIFEEVEGLVLVERTVGSKRRHGLVLALDLEQYDFSKGSQSLIRATEGTIIDRLPPRIKIREGAALELPHILVLIDDPDGFVIEPIIEMKAAYKKLYDFELMQGSGHLTGFLVDDEPSIQKIVSGLEHLAQPDHFREKYSVGEEQGILLFAMGDGNHSLATAKAIWEKNKSLVGMDHPSRYALVEIENVHDAGLEFEPIHRVLFDVKEDPLDAMKSFFKENFRYERVGSSDRMVELIENQNGPEHAIGIISSEGCGIATISNPGSNLPVGSIQQFLDDWLERDKAEEIDYVHGSETTIELGTREGNLGIFLPGMQKSDLFKTVILDGALPRKTFSMGEAHEKRFYMEARKIL